MDRAEPSEVEGHLSGLYTIHVDDQGERRFAYWRSESAARKLFAGTEWVEHVDGDVIHLSGITLQIASPQAREALLKRLHGLRMNGARISLDTNYRPSGWSSRGEATRAMDQISHATSVALATWEDEAAMHDRRTPAECADRLASLGISEVIVKSGPNGAHLLVDGRLQHVPATPVEDVVDTTAAGDSFAGAYLAARIHGLSPVDAVHTAVDVAAVVVSHPGAIIPADVSLTRAASRSANYPGPGAQ